jgi:6,7-dimethyl-8-ribityllumazine synthase
MAQFYEGKLDARKYRLAIVVSKFNHFISDKLLQGALDALRMSGGDEGKVDIYRTPGSFEIPLVTQKIAKTGRYDGIVCLGAVIRGDTPHFDYIAAEVAKGIAKVSLDEEIPVSFGVLTTDTLEQAIERAGSKGGNRGWDAAMSLLETINLLHESKLSGQSA